MDWNGNGRLDPTDIGISISAGKDTPQCSAANISLDNTKTEKTDSQITPPDLTTGPFCGCLAALALVFSAISLPLIIAGSFLL